MDSGSSPMAAGTAEPMGELVELPANLRQAFRAELARAFHSPYETPIVVLVNGLLTTLAWFLIPNSGLFTLHGALAFPIVLASWMYSDVPATNVYGPDARRVLAALDEPKALFRLLVAKSAVLWLLVVPICSTIALVLGAKEGRPVSTGFTIFWVAIAPLGALGLCSWVGVRFPYHPLPLKVRWAKRGRFRQMIVRWTLLAASPYVVFPWLAALVALPSAWIWGLFSEPGGLQRIPDRDFALGVIVGCVVAGFAWYFGLRYAVRLSLRRRAQLEAFLADPDLG